MDEVSELMQKRFFPLFALFERKNPEKQKQKKGKKTEKERKKSQTEKRGKKNPEKKKEKKREGDESLSSCCMRHPQPMFTLADGRRSLLSSACLASHRNSEDEGVDPEPSAAAPVPAPGEGGADSFHTSPCTNTFFGKATRGASVCPHHPLCLSPGDSRGWRALLVLSPARVTGEETRSCGGAKEVLRGFPSSARGDWGRWVGKQSNICSLSPLCKEWEDEQGGDRGRWEFFCPANQGSFSYPSFQGLTFTQA